MISDRHFDSTLAYQMAGRGIPEQDVNKLKNLNIFREVQPDLTFLLDVDPEKVKDRFEKRDRIEKEDLTFHRKVREAYLEIYRNEPERIVKIDALDSIEDIQKKVRKRVSSLLEEEFND